MHLSHRFMEILNSLILPPFLKLCSTVSYIFTYSNMDFAWQVFMMFFSYWNQYDPRLQLIEHWHSKSLLSQWCVKQTCDKLQRMKEIFRKCFCVISIPLITKCTQFVYFVVLFISSSKRYTCWTAFSVSNATWQFNNLRHRKVTHKSATIDSLFC